VEIVHSVGPGLSGVSVELPSVLFFGSCPVRYLETLEHGAWVSVETNITNTFEEGGRVEVLSIKMHHHIGLFVEFISVDILNAHACFSGLLDVELVGDMEEVWVDES